MVTTVEEASVATTEAGRIFTAEQGKVTMARTEEEDVTVATTEDEEIPAVTIEAERKPNSSNRESSSALLELHFGFLHSSAYITITVE